MCIYGLLHGTIIFYITLITGAYILVGVGEGMGDSGNGGKKWRFVGEKRSQVGDDRNVLSRNILYQTYIRLFSYDTNWYRISSYVYMKNIIV